MLIKEYRVVLPISVEEYQVGQLYTVIEASKNETGGGDGVEVLTNEPYEKDGEKGQYTLKKYHLQHKVPAFIRLLAPPGALEVTEEAWNAYPYCRTSEFQSTVYVHMTSSKLTLQTVLTNDYMKDKFMIKIETWHKPDMGEECNVHHICESDWQKAEVVHVDIADKSLVKNYKTETDPAVFTPKKDNTKNRGPLKCDWKTCLANNSNCPHMCAYKLVTVECKIFGVQSKLENFIHSVEKRLFAEFHRQLFCTIDNWIDLTMDDIRRMEAETQQELNEMRKNEEVKGNCMDE
ncbi:phosphatidylinositol transfer protein alpha isoform-like [Pholidichthys leucotaenia]